MKKHRIFLLIVLLLTLVPINVKVEAKMIDFGIHVNKQKAKKSDDESLLYSKLHYQWDYAKKNKIETPTFKERKKVEKFINKDNIDKVVSELIFLEERTNYTNDGYNYKKTLEETKYLYYGKLSDAKPEGIGVIFQIYDENPFDEPQLFVKYLGYFKDGKYDGYGVEFNTEQDTFSNQYNILSEVLLNQPNLYNEMIITEGYFKKGVSSGECVWYSSDLYSNLENEELLNKGPTVLTYDIVVGKSKKGYLHGSAKVFDQGKLIYDGNMKRNKYDGKGKLYFKDTGQIKYNGEFSGGLFHGKGTLYDEEGNVIHRGKFSGGNID